jgi:hypothetical protein
MLSSIFSSNHSCCQLDKNVQPKHFLWTYLAVCNAVLFAFFKPDNDVLVYIFCVIVVPQRTGFAASGDDSFKWTDNSLNEKRKIFIDGYAFRVEVIGDNVLSLK